MKRICLLIVTGALIVAGCGGSSSKSSGTGSTPASGSGGGHVNITLWHGYTDVEGTAIKALAKRVQRHPPQHHRDAAVLRQLRLRAAKGARSDRRWQAARHLLPVRLVGGEHRHQLRRR